MDATLTAFGARLGGCGEDASGKTSGLLAQVQPDRSYYVADVREEIKKYISEEFAGSADVDLDTVDLLEEEIVDSLGIFTLISFIEEKLGVAIDPTDINLDNFQNLDTITALVEGKS